MTGLFSADYAPCILHGHGTSLEAGTIAAARGQITEQVARLKNLGIDSSGTFPWLLVTYLFPLVRLTPNRGNTLQQTARDYRRNHEL